MVYILVSTFFLIFWGLRAKTIGPKSTWHISVFWCLAFPCVSRKTTSPQFASIREPFCLDHLIMGWTSLFRFVFLLVLFHIPKSIQTKSKSQNLSQAWLHLLDLSLFVKKILDQVTIKKKTLPTFQDHTPWKINMEHTVIMEFWKMIFLSKWVICRFHVNLPGCNST